MSPWGHGSSILRRHPQSGLLHVSTVPASFGAIAAFLRLDCPIPAHLRGRYPAASDRVQRERRRSAGSTSGESRRARPGSGRGAARRGPRDGACGRRLEPWQPRTPSRDPKPGRLAFLAVPAGEAHVAQDPVQETISRAPARRRLRRGGEEVMAGFSARHARQPRPQAVGGPGSKKGRRSSNVRFGRRSHPGERLLHPPRHGFCVTREPIEEVDRAAAALYLVTLLDQRSVAICGEVERPPSTGAKEAVGHRPEGELGTPRGGENFASPGPPKHAESVAATEAGTNRAERRSVEPAASVALRTPLSHAGDVCDEVVDVLGCSGHLELRRSCLRRHTEPR